MNSIDFNMDVIDPMQAAVSGFERGQTAQREKKESDARMTLMEAQQSEYAAREAQVTETQERMQAGQTKLAALAEGVKDDTWTAEDFYSLQIEYPDYAKHIAGVYEDMNEEQKANGIGLLQRVAVAAQTNPEEAKGLLEQEAMASQNAGDEQGAKAARAQIRLLETAPEAFMTGVLSQLAGGMEKGQFEIFSETVRPEPKVDLVAQQEFDNLVTTQNGDLARDKFDADRTDANRNYQLARDKQKLESDKFSYEKEEDAAAAMGEGDAAVSSIEQVGKYPPPRRLSVDDLNEAGVTSVDKREAAAMDEIRAVAKESVERSALMSQFLTMAAEPGWAFGAKYVAQGEGFLNDIGQVFSQRTTGLKAITNKLAPSEREEGSGSTSDADIKMFKSGTVSINNTPSANKRIANNAVAMADNSRAYVSFLEDYVNDYGRGSLEGGKQLWRDYSEAEPIFDPVTGEAIKGRVSFDDWNEETNGDMFDDADSNEGTIAVNPETGERLIMRNGVWEPL